MFKAGNESLLCYCPNKTEAPECSMRPLWCVAFKFLRLQIISSHARARADCRTTRTPCAEAGDARFKPLRCTSERGFPPRGQFISRKLWFKLDSRTGAALKLIWFSPEEQMCGKPAGQSFLAYRLLDFALCEDKIIQWDNETIRGFLKNKKNSLKAQTVKLKLLWCPDWWDRLSVGGARTKQEIKDLRWTEVSL